VFFVRHNGGSVWFDQLGRPWPKHECFDEDLYGIQLRRLLTSPDQVFGVIIETETTRPGEAGRIMVRCCDGTLINEEFPTSANTSLFLGRLVIVDRGEPGKLSLQFVNPPQPRKFAYVQIKENGTHKVVEEFAYCRKSEAEQLLFALQTQYPGKYRLVMDKRYEY